MRRVRTVGLNAANEALGGQAPLLADWLVDRGQRGRGPAGRRDVVISDHRQVVRNAHACLRCGEQDPDRRDVAGGDDRGRQAVLLEQVERRTGIKPNEAHADLGYRGHGIGGDDIEIISELARRLGTDWGNPTAQEVWDELRSLSPMHGGMSYQRLDSLGGIQWPCPDEQHPGELFLHARLWETDPARRGAPAPFTPVEQEAPLDELSAEFPIRLTTGRRLDSFNTGVQTGKYATPIRRPETINLAPEDAARLGLAEGEVARVSSRRGSVQAPVHLAQTLRPGLAFMTLHFPEQVATNILTLDAWDPKSGTAEFKATAIRVDKVSDPTTGDNETPRAKAGA